MTTLADPDDDDDGDDGSENDAPAVSSKSSAKPHPKQVLAPVNRSAGYYYP
jgi:hypothetical protein